MAERDMTMIKQANRAIEHMTARDRRVQRAKYARRNKMLPSISLVVSTVMAPLGNVIQPSLAM